MSLLIYHEKMARTDFLLALGQRIRFVRIQMGMTQEQLAERINLSRGAVARYELGEIEPKLQNLTAIADVLNVSTDYLLNRDIPNPGMRNRLSERAIKAMDVFISEVLNSK